MADLTTYPLSPNYWKWAKRHGLDDRTTRLGAYFLSCDHRNLEGLYYLPRDYMAADHKWSLEDLEGPFRTLLNLEFVMYDEDVEVILLPNALAYYTPKSAPQIKGAMNALLLVPDTSILWPYFLIGAKRNAPRFFEALGGDSELANFPEVIPTGEGSGTLPEGLPEAA